MKVAVIGSGLGSLTSAAFLAKAGMDVTVVERHDRIGGYAHNFRRKNFNFESGIHTAPLADDGVVRGLLTRLGVNDQIETVRFPEMYRTISPYGTQIMPENRGEIITSLHEKFPHQKSGLTQFFTDLSVLHDNIFTLFEEGKRGFIDENHAVMERFQHHSYDKYLSGLFDDDALKFFLSGQWPYVGITPKHGQHLFLQMLFATHFFDGSYGVKGGFSTVASALASVVTNSGGRVILRDEVVGVRMEGKRAVALETENGLEIPADIIVSGISPYVLHNRLLSEESRSSRWRTRLSRLNPADSAVIVYLGMRQGYENLIDSNVGIWFRHRDVEKPYERIHSGSGFECDNLAILHSVECIADPVISLFSFVQQSDSTQWKTEKMVCAEKMLKVLEEVYPGIREYIAFVEVGSPDTFERYTLNTHGAIYGFENTCSRYGEAKMPIKQHIENLYQAGHWSRPGCGVFNTILNGYTVSEYILLEQS